jgi:bifunctional N-acetylglucosamine-1-phosphate-uridyltransferase/glucosamine-1-phosphate-acetyltransferase GlmU-like protein
MEQVIQEAESALRNTKCSWSFVEQVPLMGTGHALKLAASKVPPNVETTLCLNGDDSSLLTPISLRRVIEQHNNSGSSLSLVTADVIDSFVFGRVLASPPNIIEFLTYTECIARSLLPLPVVTGIYCFQREWLNTNLDCFYPDKRGELPIYQIVYRARDSGAKWNTISLPSEYWASANTPEEFAALNELFVRLQSNE